MPEFASATHAHAHTVHSALVSLASLGVAAHRITLRRVGREARAAGTIVSQEPRAGTSLVGGVAVRLDIAGLGFSQALPVGMWDSGGEAEAGTREILEPFDDPLEKLQHWFHEGAPLFRIALDDMAACARWLALFGITAESWPRALWYRLASMIADVPSLACSEDGCSFVLGALLALPVAHFQHYPTWSVLPESMLSKLGRRSTRLGIDAVLGDAVEGLATTVVEIGPVPLSLYERFVETEAGATLLAHVLELLMPLTTHYEVRWTVLDASRPPRLGSAQENGRLGVNSHLGTSFEWGAPFVDRVPPSAAAGTDPLIRSDPGGSYNDFGATP